MGMSKDHLESSEVTYEFIKVIFTVCGFKLCQWLPYQMICEKKEV